MFWYLLPYIIVAISLLLVLIIVYCVYKKDHRININLEPELIRFNLEGIRGEDENENEASVDFDVLVAPERPNGSR